MAALIFAKNTSPKKVAQAFVDSRFHHAKAIKALNIGSLRLVGLSFENAFQAQALVQLEYGYPSAEFRGAIFNCPNSLALAYLFLLKPLLLLKTLRHFFRRCLNSQLLNMSDYLQQMFEHRKEVGQDYWLSQLSPAPVSSLALSSSLKISVLMPVYRTPLLFLEKAIRSVQKQSYSNWELCIVDDHSQDSQLADFLKSESQKDYRIKIFSHSQNLRIAETTNKAFQQSSGDLVCLLDHDDELAPQALDRIAHLFSEQKNIMFSYSDEVKIDASGYEFSPSYKPAPHISNLLTANHVNHLIAFRRELFQKIGPLKTEFDGAQDHDFVIRVFKNYSAEQIAHISEILYKWRSHAESTAIRPEAKSYAFENGLRCLKSHFPQYDFQIKNDGTYQVSSPAKPLPQVAVVIPVYNTPAEHLEVCYQSLKKQTYQNIEIIFADDASSQEETRKKLKNLSQDKIVRTLFLEQNKGPAAARNKAINSTAADYILPLDSDDFIDPTYVEKAVASMQSHPQAGIIYCKARFTGDRQEPWYLPPFSLPEMLVHNLIFATALFRREDWQLTGGYQEEPRELKEDWDFWIKVLRLGRQVYQIPEELFFYRYQNQSRNRQTESFDSLSYLRKKYPELYQNIDLPKLQKRFRRSPIKVSVITVCRNEKARIQETINSVLSQTYKEIEWLVIDGQSSDGTVEILNQYRSHMSYYVSEKDQGIYSAQNKGAAKAQGDYLIFLNGGDSFYDPSAIEKLVTSAQDADLVYGNMWVDNGQGERYLGLMPKHLSLRHMVRSTLWHPVTLISRECFLHYGPYDESLKIVADYDFFFKAIIAAKVKTTYVSFPIAVFYTDGTASNPDSEAQHQRERLTVQNKYLSEQQKEWLKKHENRLQHWPYTWLSFLYNLLPNKLKLP